MPEPETTSRMTFNVLVELRELLLKECAELRKLEGAKVNPTRIVNEALLEYFQRRNKGVRPKKVASLAPARLAKARSA